MHLHNEQTSIHSCKGQGSKKMIAFRFAFDARRAARLSLMLASREAGSPRRARGGWGLRSEAVPDVKSVLGVDKNLPERQLPQLLSPSAQPIALTPSRNLSFHQMNVERNQGATSMTIAFLELRFCLKPRTRQRLGETDGESATSSDGANWRPLSSQERLFLDIDVQCLLSGRSRPESVAGAGEPRQTRPRLWRANVVCYLALSSRSIFGVPHRNTTSDE